MVLNEHLSEGTNAVAVSVLLRKLTDGNFSEIALNRVAEKLFVSLGEGRGHGACENKRGSEGDNGFVAHYRSPYVSRFGGTRVSAKRKWLLSCSTQLALSSLGDSPRRRAWCNSLRRDPAPTRRTVTQW